MIPGSLSETKAATSEQPTLVDMFKAEVENGTGVSYEEFKALKYSTQVVAGVNCYVSVKVDSTKDDVLFLRIFKPLPGAGDAKLIGYLAGKTSSDELVIF